MSDSAVAPAVEMTEQAIFDRTWQRYVIEGKPLSGNDGGCYYRRDDEIRCAIGWEIMDIYDSSMDGSKGGFVMDILSKWPCVSERFSGIDVKFLSRLQAAHDRATFIHSDGIEASLRKLAQECSLTIPGEGALSV